MYIKPVLRRDRSRSTLIGNQLTLFKNGRVRRCTRMCQLREASAATRRFPVSLSRGVSAAIARHSNIPLLFTLYIYSRRRFGSRRRRTPSMHTLPIDECLRYYPTRIHPHALISVESRRRFSPSLYRKRKRCERCDASRRHRIVHRSVWDAHALVT